MVVMRRPFAVLMSSTRSEILSRSRLSRAESEGLPCIPPGGKAADGGANRVVRGLLS